MRVYSYSLFIFIYFLSIYYIVIYHNKFNEYAIYLQCVNKSICNWYHLLVWSDEFSYQNLVHAHIIDIFLCKTKKNVTIPVYVWN